MAGKKQRVRFVLPLKKQLDREPALFLYGIEKMSVGMQKRAGNKMRSVARRQWLQFVDSLFPAVNQLCFLSLPRQPENAASLA